MIIKMRFSLLTKVVVVFLNMFFSFVVTLTFCTNSVHLCLKEPPRNLDNTRNRSLLSVKKEHHWLTQISRTINNTYTDIKAMKGFAFQSFITKAFGRKDNHTRDDTK